MPFYRRFSDMPLISISNAQRTSLGSANFVGTVYHGLPLDLHKPSRKPASGYLAFLGRISPEKRPDRAVAIARAAGLPLKIAAKVDKLDEAYFREMVAPLLEGTEIEFVGEINETAKTEFLGQAAGLLFPIDWPEPFGLVMIEAMACGTPVLAFRCGSVPEIVEDKLTGRIVSSIDEAAQAIPELLALDRNAIRARFEQRFSSPRMASDYVKIYHTTLRTHPAPEIQLSPVVALSVAKAGARAHRSKTGMRNEPLAD
jgi:glycosyltransferase involved in cell wall biosynthesis